MKFFSKRPYLSDVPSRWVEFSNEFNLGIVLHKYGYFDERPIVHVTITQLISIFIMVFTPHYLLVPFIIFGWGKLYIKLPIRTGTQEAESPSWGFYYHDSHIWVYIGGDSDGIKSLGFKMPWFLRWYRTSILLKNGSWCHEKEGDRKNFWKREDWDEVRWSCDVTHKKLGLKGIATVTEMEWRRNWLYRFPLFNFVRRRIEIEFEDTSMSKNQQMSYDIGGSEEYYRELEKIGFESIKINRFRKINQILE
jgi:hypothetical protein